LCQKTKVLSESIITACLKKAMKLHTADARGIFQPAFAKAPAGLSAWDIARNPPKLKK
jgi:hypothetical protein